MDEKWIEQNDDPLFMYKWIRMGCPLILIICKNKDHENDETKEQK